MVSEEVYINSLITSLYKRDLWGILIENFKNYMTGIIVMVSYKPKYFI